MPPTRFWCPVSVVPGAPTGNMGLPFWSWVQILTPLGPPLDYSMFHFKRNTRKALAFLSSPKRHEKQIIEDSYRGFWNGETAIHDANRALWWHCSLIWLGMCSVLFAKPRHNSLFDSRGFKTRFLTPLLWLHASHQYDTRRFLQGYVAIHFDGIF